MSWRARPTFPDSVRTLRSGPRLAAGPPPVRPSGSAAPALDLLADPGLGGAEVSLSQVVDYIELVEPGTGRDARLDETERRGRRVGMPEIELFQEEVAPGEEVLRLGDDGASIGLFRRSRVSGKLLHDAEVVDRPGIVGVLLQQGFQGGDR